jgi:hypothetical protein
MPDSFEKQPWVQLGVAAALARQYGADQRQFLDLLAVMLDTALPGEAQIDRRGGLFVRKKPVRRVRILLGDILYTLEDPGIGSLRASCTKIVRGIALKTDEIPVETWLSELGAALDERARVSLAAREALARMIG